jgi:hypothetical protein
VGAGKAQITASQAGNKNYNAATNVNQWITINQGNQTISFPSILPKNYGDPDLDPGAISTSGLPITYTSSNPVVATVINGLLHITGAWVAQITASQAGNGNYNAAASVTQLLIVNKSNQVINFPPIAYRELGASDFDPGATASSNLQVSYQSSNPAVAIIVSNKIRIVGTGNTDIIASQPGNGNYNAADQVTQNFLAVPTGVADLNSLGIRIYPNPASEKLYVEYNGMLKSIELVNLIGKSISLVNVTRDRTEIDVTSLPAGVYFLRIVGKDFRRDVKFMVTK